MAKRGFVKSIQKSGSIKKLSATFISLAFLFVISIVLHFVFNKQFREGNKNMKKAPPVQSVKSNKNNVQYTDDGTDDEAND
jgi:preprotein translocase subunit SecG